jgi:hypothetical protein
MSRSVSVGILMCALGVGFAAPESQLPLRQGEAREGIEELRRSVHEAAACVVKAQRDDINDDAICFDR